MSEYVSIEEFNALKNAYIDTVALLANALKRITQLEEAFFAHDEEGEIIKNLEDKPVLSPDFTRPHEKPTEQEKDNSPIIPDTTLDLKACAVVEHLKEAVKPNEFGVFAIDKKTLDTFMTEKISEELRVKKVSRQLKKDIFKRAIELFSDIVYIKTSQSGNKTKYLALKSSLKRTDTNACTRLTGLGIWA